MAKKATPPQPHPANLTPEKMKQAIITLNRRVLELDRADVSDWSDDKQNELDSLHTKIEDSLVFIFGLNSTEYNQFQVAYFSDSVPMSLFEELGPHDWQSGYKKGMAGARAKLQTVIEILEEKLEDRGESDSGQALRAYEGLDLHPEIHRAAGELYLDGHYANAIEDSVKALNSLVRMRSGIEDRDGSTLMEFVFNPQTPIIKFNSLADDSDRNEQKGFMMMFSGAVSGLRNPRAHKLIVDNSERALEFIAFVSLLAKLLDEGEL